ncbi:NADH-quinone oxidoreductase subunit H [Desulfohalobiaceae bacterium Ax17]|uniref:respiratory chain complex I subunit 1 family protein n=1 Tax=Desulfovulcanus ferrireducens TaxID=2831190 RepID=UPI00207BB67F|nr:complex I subunit 1 family protein [Desulfovulcanus ferrireducens]MBT8764123.1 NADH-quinone oxidoreductase subunit H [Desulfovulcanus ferrireducens]
MFTTKNLLIGLIAIIVAPLLGGIISGLDRKLTAWFQGRYGPPILQPFYDVFKLLGKKKMIVNYWQVFCAHMYLISAASCVLLFALRSDLLMIFFVLTIGSVFMVIGALSTPSPYSQIGAQRELMQMLTYEPLLILVFVSIYFVTGSFKISDIMAYDKPIFLMLPLMYLVLGFALTIKLRKSPFDISTSHHAHQEIVKGVLTEYSGPHLAIIEIAHWYEIVLILAICALFWATSWIGMIILLVITYLGEILIDNLVTRATWRWMLTYVWGVGIGLSFINIAFLYAKYF